MRKIAPKRNAHNWSKASILPSLTCKKLSSTHQSATVPINYSHKIELTLGCSLANTQQSFPTIALLGKDNLALGDNWILWAENQASPDNSVELHHKTKYSHTATIDFSSLSKLVERIIITLTLVQTKYENPSQASLEQWQPNTTIRNAHIKILDTSSNSTLLSFTKVDLVLDASTIVLAEFTRNANTWSIHSVGKSSTHNLSELVNSYTLYSPKINLSTKIF